MKARCLGLALGVVLAIPPWTVYPTLSNADDALPSWYKKKKADEKAKEDERREDELKKLEKPQVGAPLDSGPPPVSQISQPEQKVIVTDLLFKRAGLTSSINLGVGYLSQPELPGTALSGGMGVGWWWKPNLVLMPYLRANAIFASNYTFVLTTLSPMLRWYPAKSWALGIELGVGVSIGLSRVTESRLPTPPEGATLRTRNGPTAGIHVAHMFWTSRVFALGPVLQARWAKQDERSVFDISIGVTFQDARPDYTGGDLTQSDW